ncbi:DUF3106 domain-containing protein [Lysobacter solisilvae (ex Woo and Kim 2020)]|uniref:DUF3106 domain-containing protein n=1 Tax=Agrilutibacter terrestris TaxID=2865112 RepID=A0A7H0FUZ9_9GAMM|nr:DUF3106 domain-containing protein [Lysobacter terrestris]QNP39865.1 DUF3106 domain-containing protein [Lysobacter terrestris]
MKPLRHVFVLSLLLCASAFAQGAPDSRPAPAARAYPAWEQLSVAEREMLLAPVRERWNSNPEQRARMMEHAQRWQTMSPEQRKRMHRGMKRWGHMSPEQRDHARALFGEMRNMTPEQRQDLRAKWKAMTPAERDAWIKAHPAPPR